MLVIVFVITGCGADIDQAEIERAAKRSPLIYFCEVNDSAPYVRYKVTKIIREEIPGSAKFSEGDYLPIRGPEIESGVEYGDHALIFFTHAMDTGKLSMDMVAIFHDNIAGDKERLEQIFTKIRNQDEN